MATSAPDRKHRSKARAWAWSARTEPSMKLVLLAIARTGDIDATDELRELTGLPLGSFKRVMEKLREQHYLERIQAVLDEG